MDDLVKEGESLPEDALETVEEVPAATGQAIEGVASKVEEAAEKASEAAQNASTHSEHEVLAGVASALTLLNAELKRANDLREFESKQAREVVADASQTAAAPVAEIVDPPPARKVRRGARKVTKKG